MFIHIGDDCMISSDEVVAILDVGVCDSPTFFTSLFQAAQEKGYVQQIATSDQVKSYIITDALIYASPVSSSTLMKRVRQMPDNE